MSAMATNDGDNLKVALTTWIYLLHVAGKDAGDADVVAACQAVDRASDETVGDLAGMALVERVTGMLSGGSEPASVRSLAERLYGDAVAGELGAGDRAERLAKIRRYQFAKGLPWLARIWERRGDRVLASWLLVEKVSDVVYVMDPNPWDDVPEERKLAIEDFQVLWELDACTSVHLA